MNSFIKSTFSEPDGTGSMKRLVLFILVILFVTIVIYCHLTKTNPFVTLEGDVKTFILYFGGLIFGTNIGGQIKDIMNTKSATTGTNPDPVIPAAPAPPPQQQ